MEVPVVFAKTGVFGLSTAQIRARLFYTRNDDFLSGRGAAGEAIRGPETGGNRGCREG